MTSTARERTSRAAALYAVLSIVLVLALAALTLVMVTRLGFFSRTHPTAFIVGTAGLWVLFAVTVIAIRRVPLRAALAIILAGSALIGGISLAGPPNTSTDSARYAWDGIVQDAGVSPYAHVPVDSALQDLRPQWLFPAAIESADGSYRCADPRMNVTSSMPSARSAIPTKFCTAINRPMVPTIYPAAGEMYFAVVRFFVEPDAEYWPLQLAGLLLSLATTVILMVGMRRRGIDQRWSALWALSPFVATEAINNSHVDVFGTILVLVASLLVSRRMPLRGGIALGAAIAVKLVPAIAAPALLRRRPVRVIVAAVLTFVVLYIPYVIASGLGVIGYLPGYLTEEGYSDGGRFTLLSIFLPSAAAIPVAAVLLLVTAVLVVLRSNPDSPWLGQLVMIGTTLLIASPRYPWYALLLVPFIALTGRWEWFAVPLALTYRLFLPPHLGDQIVLSIATVLIVAMAVYRTGPAGRARLRHPAALLRRRSPD